MVHAVLLSRSILDDIQENIDSRFAVLGHWTVSMHGKAMRGGNTEKNRVCQ